MRASALAAAAPGARAVARCRPDVLPQALRTQIPAASTPQRLCAQPGRRLRPPPLVSLKPPRLRGAPLSAKAVEVDAVPALAAPSPEPPRLLPAPPAGEVARLTRVGNAPLAGGVLHEVRVGPLTLASPPDGQGTRGDFRTVRVWLPDKLPSGALNVLIMLDGQNLFTDDTAYGGRCWHVATTAAALAGRKEAPPFAVIGIDHAGVLRSLDYLPCVPGTGMGGFRPEAATWAGGGIERFLDALTDVVLPSVRAEFGLTADPARTAFGGSSFAGIATLHAVTSRHKLGSAFSAALIESPSLWIDNGNYMRSLLAATRAGGVAWPQRVFLAMGMREHSGSRPGSGGLGAAVDAQHACSATMLAAAMGVSGLGEKRLSFMLEPAAGHSERDWARRLPRALRFLMSPMPEIDPASCVMLPPPKADAPSALEVARNAAIAAAAAPPDVETARNCGSMFYFEPRELVAGAPASIYFNRALSATEMLESEGLKMHYGVDGWAGGPAGPAVELQQAGLPEGEGDWWRGRIPPLPAAASELNFVFSDAAGSAWDNANGADYSARVLSLEEAAVAVAPRRVLEAAEHELAGGILHILTLAPRDGAAAGSKAEARAARWQEEKILRIWTPPGWQKGKAPPGGYPVLYCCDAQNLFEDWLAHQGLSWRAAESLEALITSGALPPMLLVGIDAAGAFRSLNLLPFPPGTGLGNFRPECARWPGGGVDAFLRRVIGEVLPLAESRFGASRRRERRAFGGASFGGVAALQAALAHGDIFGGVLAESPSLWVGEGRYLETMERHSGEALPDRLFLGSGTREYSGTRDHENPEIDELLADYHAKAAAILESKGMTDGRLRFQCDEGAAHHESAWGWRLSGALLHLFHGRT